MGALPQADPHGEIALSLRVTPHPALRASGLGCRSVSPAPGQGQAPARPSGTQLRQSQCSPGLAPASSLCVFLPRLPACPLRPCPMPSIPLTSAVRHPPPSAPTLPGLTASHLCSRLLRHTQHPGLPACALTPLRPPWGPWAPGSAVTALCTRGARSLTSCPPAPLPLSLPSHLPLLLARRLRAPRRLLLRATFTLPPRRARPPRHSRP